MPNYRQPTDKETEKLNKSRKMMVEGIEGEKDLLSKISTTMAKDARDQIRAGKALRETVPASAREGEAYQSAGYKKGGKVKKMRKFQTGGVSNPSFREEKQKEIENKKLEREAKAQSKKEAMAQRAYKEAVAMYENELRLDPQDTNPIGYKIRKFEDKIGDKVRSIGKNVFGTNQMTSMDDEAQMQARKDVKGYKAGGKVSSASKRADGIAIRGKTRA